MIRINDWSSPKNYEREEEGSYHQSGNKAPSDSVRVADKTVRYGEHSAGEGEREESALPARFVVCHSRFYLFRARTDRRGSMGGKGGKGGGWEGVLFLRRPTTSHLKQ